MDKYLGCIDVSFVSIQNDQEGSLKADGYTNINGAVTNLPEWDVAPGEIASVSWTAPPDFSGNVELYVRIKDLNGSKLDENMVSGTLNCQSANTPTGTPTQTQVALTNTPTGTPTQTQVALTNTPTEMQHLTETPTPTPPQEESTPSQTPTLESEVTNTPTSEESTVATGTVTELPSPPPSTNTTESSGGGAFSIVVFVALIVLIAFLIICGIVIAGAITFKRISVWKGPGK
jgi:hypothetical protein